MASTKEVIYRKIKYKKSELQGFPMVVSLSAWPLAIYSPETKKNYFNGIFGLLDGF
jgi:hypothetical protein